MYRWGVRLLYYILHYDVYLCIHFAFVLYMYFFCFGLRTLRISCSIAEICRHFKKGVGVGCSITTSPTTLIIIYRLSRPAPSGVRHSRPEHPQGGFRFALADRAPPPKRRLEFSRRPADLAEAEMAARHHGVVCPPIPADDAHVLSLDYGQGGAEGGANTTTPFASATTGSGSGFGSGFGSRSGSGSRSRSTSGSSSGSSSGSCP